MLPFTTNENAPLYQQIVDYIEDQIYTGNIAEGDRVPSVRELGEQLGVNPNTCVKAYEILIENQIIETRRGTGSWVLSTARKKISQKKREEFTTKTIPLIIHTMRRYDISKNMIIELINTLYDDPKYAIK